MTLSGLLSSVVAGLIVLVLSWVAGQLGRRIISRATRFYPQVTLLASRTVYFGILALGVVLAFSIAFQSQNIAIVAVVASALIAGTGIQDLVRNYVSGFYILIERNIKIGDVIEFNGSSGVVEDIRLRVSYLRGAEGELVVVPNTELFNRPVVINPRAATPGPPE